MNALSFLSELISSESPLFFWANAYLLTDRIPSIQMLKFNQKISLTLVRIDLNDRIYSAS